MHKQLFCTSLCKFVFLLMVAVAPVHSVHAQQKITSGDGAASDIGVSGSSAQSLSEQEKTEWERVGCNPNIYKELMTKYNDEIQTEQQKIQKQLEEPPPIADLSCLGDQLEELWGNAEDILKTVKGGFSNGFDVKGLFNGALDSIKDSITRKKQNLVEFACKQAEGLKDFILDQGQCFDFSKMFRWDKVHDFDFKGCLINARFDLSNNGFKYNISSDFADMGAEGSFGFSDKLLLGNDGVNALFDSGRWNPVERGTFNDSYACGNLEESYQTAQSSGGLNLFNPSSQLRYDEETGDLYWDVAQVVNPPHCGEQGYPDCVETRSSCYEIKMSTDAPAGTCYVTDANGNIERNNGLPKLNASITNDMLCGSTSLNDVLSGSAQSSTNSNVTCLGTNAFADACGTGASVACCDPAFQDCSASTVPMCYCAYPTQSNVNPPLEITMWQTQELPSGVITEFSDWAQKWGISLGNPANPMDDILVATTCSAGLIENCCNPELNDCEGNPMLSTMPQCLDESKICVDLTNASILNSAVDSDGDGVFESMTQDLTQELDAKDLFTLFEYLVIEPDAQIHAYAAEDQSPTGQQRDIQCCATEWCNICPDMVRGAWRIRNELNMFPSDIGIGNNKFVINTTHAVFPGNTGKIGVDYGGGGAGYFASYETGNIYAKRDSGRTQTALQADITQPPKSHCLNIAAVPASVVECAHIKRQSGFWNSTGFGEFICNVPIVGGLINLLSGGGCEDASGQCEDVPKLPGNMQAYEPELLREGLPISNISHDASWEGEDPKLCSDYATCDQIDSATSPDIRDFVVKGDNLEDYPEEQRPLMCAYLCDNEGLSSDACVQCAPEYLSCPLNCITRGRGQTPCVSCVDNAIEDIATDENDMPAEYCVSICLDNPTSQMCRSCAPEYGCTVCELGNTRLTNQCTSCINDLQDDLGSPDAEDLDEPTPTTTTNTSTSTSTGGGHVAPETPAQHRTPARPTAPAQTTAPQQTEQPAWKEQPSVAPTKKPSSSGDGSSGGIKDVLKGLF